MTTDPFEDVLPSWRPGPAREAILAFLASVTEGPDAVPVPRRIAAFDNDGTLQCEKPYSLTTAFLLHQTPDAPEPPPGLKHPSDALLMTVLVGATVEEYEDVAVAYLRSSTHPRFGRPWTSLVYPPMVELIGLLHRLDFTVYVVSGGSRDLLRVFAGDVYGLGREDVIGDEVRLEYAGGRIVRRPELTSMDRGPGKPVHLWSRAGALPLFAAGNTIEDRELLDSARFGLLVNHNDADREYAYEEADALAAAADRGWTVASMRDDFLSVFPDPS